MPTFLSSCLQRYRGRKWEKHQGLLLATLRILASPWQQSSLHVCCGLLLEWPPTISSCGQSVLQLSRTLLSAVGAFRGKGLAGGVDDLGQALGS